MSSEILKRLNFVEEESNTLGVLVIGNEQFCEKLCECLQGVHVNKCNKYQLFLVCCTKIEEILCQTSNLCIDYVVFLLDMRIKQCATDVEYNLQKMDKSFLCGRTCVVNSNCNLPYSQMRESLNTVLSLKRKYNVTLLNGDVMEPESCLNLSDKILRLVETNLGVKQKLPFLPWLLAKKFD